MKKHFLSLTLTALTLSAYAVNPAGHLPAGCRNPQAAAKNPNCSPSSPPSAVVVPVATGTTATTPLLQTIPATPLAPAATGQTPSTPPQPLVAIGTSGPAFTGFGKAPPQPVPSPYAVPPAPSTPPQQLVGTGTTGPAFTGFGKIPPEPVPSPYAVPPAPSTPPQPDNVVVHYVPSQTIVGYGLVTPTAYLVPDILSGNPPGLDLTPQLTPQPFFMTPVKPHKVETGKSVQHLPVPYPSAKGKLKNLKLHVTREVNDKNSPNHHHVPSRAGRNLVEGYRSQFVTENGSVWTCALSGLSQRTFQDDKGMTHVSGHAETMQFQEATTVHIPGNRRQEANCLIAVKKQIQRASR